MEITNLDFISSIKFQSISHLFPEHASHCVQNKSSRKRGWLLQKQLSQLNEYV